MKMTCSKSRLYHLGLDWWPDWYHFPKISECVYTRVTPFLFVLRWSGLKIEFQYFGGRFYLRYYDAISADKSQFVLSPDVIREYIKIVES